jgi:hypothetical protein
MKIKNTLAILILANILLFGVLVHCTIENGYSFDYIDW